jgi:hypothetical protein
VKKIEMKPRGFLFIQVSWQFISSLMFSRLTLFSSVAPEEQPADRSMMISSFDIDIDAVIR